MVYTLGMPLKNTSLGSYRAALCLSFVVGIVALWLVGHFAHIPGEHVSHQTVYVTQSPRPTTKVVTPSTNNDNVAESNVAMPPIYSPSTKTASGSNGTTYTSSSPWYAVLNFYGEQLSENGWTIATESTQNNTTVINAKSNGSVVSVSITNSGNNQATFTIQVN